MQMFGAGSDGKIYVIVGGKAQETVACGSKTVQSVYCAE